MQWQMWQFCPFLCTAKQVVSTLCKHAILFLYSAYLVITVYIACSLHRILQISHLSSFCTFLLSCGSVDLLNGKFKGFYWWRWEPPKGLPRKNYKAFSMHWFERRCFAMFVLPKWFKLKCSRWFWLMLYIIENISIWKRPLSKCCHCSRLSRCP